MYWCRPRPRGECRLVAIPRRSTRTCAARTPDGYAAGNCVHDRTEVARLFLMSRLRFGEAHNCARVLAASNTSPLTVMLATPGQTTPRQTTSGEIGGFLAR
jgi:hypothetical protein